MDEHHEGHPAYHHLERRRVTLKKELNRGPKENATKRAGEFRTETEDGAKLLKIAEVRWSQATCQDRARKENKSGLDSGLGSARPAQPFFFS